MKEVKIITKEEIQSVWNRFKEEIQHKNRFFFNQDILALLEIFFAKNMMPLFSKDTKMKFYRARGGSFSREDDCEILEAPPGLPDMGRCNPRGISYLYAAFDIPTAIVELRLKRKNNYKSVTVAELEIDMGNIFSFLPYNQSYLQKALNLTEEERYFMEIINSEFSKSVFNNKLDYIPLQYISEYIKNKGFDGFVYSSSLSPNGINLVLFNKEKRRVLRKGEMKMKPTERGYEYGPIEWNS